MHSIHCWSPLPHAATEPALRARKPSTFLPNSPSPSVKFSTDQPPCRDDPATRCKFSIQRSRVLAPSPPDLPSVRPSPEPRSTPYAGSSLPQPNSPTKCANSISSDKSDLSEPHLPKPTKPPFGQSDKSEHAWLANGNPRNHRNRERGWAILAMFPRNCRTCRNSRSSRNPSELSKPSELSETQPVHPSCTSF